MVGAAVHSSNVKRGVPLNTGDDLLWCLARNCNSAGTLQPIRPIDNDILPLGQTLFLALAAGQASDVLSADLEVGCLGNILGNILGKVATQRSTPSRTPQAPSNTRIASAGPGATVTPQ
jgi:hypothetical protein